MGSGMYKNRTLNAALTSSINDLSNLSWALSSQCSVLSSRFLVQACCVKTIKNLIIQLAGHAKTIKLIQIIFQLLYTHPNAFSYSNDDVSFRFFYFVKFLSPKIYN